MKNKTENELIEEHYNLIRYVIKKKFNDYLYDEDILQIGAIGLLKAIRSYDECKKIKFSTFAHKCIYFEICKHFRVLNYDKRIPKDKIIYINDKLKSDEINSNNDMFYEDIFYDDTNHFEMLEDKIVSKELLDILNKKEKDIVLLNINGYSNCYISKKYKMKKIDIQELQNDCFMKMRKYLVREDVC